MSGKIFVGIDTSNYTTSVAAVNENGDVISNIKKLLPVAPGERGLRQSDAVFAHIKAVPEIMDRLCGEVFGFGGYSSDDVAAVGYSSLPRDVDGSYMPCFLVGEAAAHSFAALRNIPVFSSSHQAGHIMAALYSSDSIDLISEKFAAFHVSGGTTDLMLIEPDEEKIIRVDKIGGTLDINAGQAIDRAGVMMGFSFPAGSELEKTAFTFKGDVPELKCV